MIELFDTQAIKVLHAAMLSMVQDVHVCQDNLTEDDWACADRLFAALDVEINLRIRSTEEPWKIGPP